MKRTSTTLLSLAAVSFYSALSPAQEAPPGGEGEGAPPPSVTVVQVPAPTTQVQVPGYPAPGVDPNAHLPSSSRGTSDTSRSSDGFDLRPGTGPAGSVHGTATGAYVVEGNLVPEAHTVRRGDTLWEISGQYYKNPYNWPRVWAYNQQIQNPHWIYPGDRVRLREGGAAAQQGAGLGLARRRATVPPETIFLRDMGWVDDEKNDAWGQIVGSPDDQMLLSDGDDVYIQLEGDHEIALGQELTIWRPVREVEGENASGSLISIRGTARVDRYNPKTRLARAHVIESLDVIERGARVGPVSRRFDVVPPATNDTDVTARILAAIYPHQLYGQFQVVFLDKGEKDGIKPGNRFFAVRRGDPWKQSLKGAGTMARYRPKVHEDAAARIEPADEPDADEDLFPDETYAEIRVLRVKDHTATALVTASTHEIERTAVLHARKGY